MTEVHVHLGTPHVAAAAWFHLGEAQDQHLKQTFAALPQD